MDLKLDHHTKDGIEIVDVEGEIDVYTAPRLRELLIELVNNGYYQLVVNMEKVEFLDSTGLGVLVGGLKRVRAHDGSLDLVCTQERILKIFRITGPDQGLRHPRHRGRGHRGPEVGEVARWADPARWPRSRCSFTALPAHVRTARLVATAVARRSGVERPAGRGPARGGRGVLPRGRGAPGALPGRAGPGRADRRRAGSRSR